MAVSTGTWMRRTTGILSNMKCYDEINLSENYADINEFVYNSTEFKKSTTLRDFLNKTFSASLVAVYTSGSTKPNTSTNLDWSGDTIIVVNAAGTVVKLSNSEWAFISKLG